MSKKQDEVMRLVIADSIQEYCAPGFEGVEIGVGGHPKFGFEDKRLGGHKKLVPRRPVSFNQSLYAKVLAGAVGIIIDEDAQRYRDSLPNPTFPGKGGQLKVGQHARKPVVNSLREFAKAEVSSAMYTLYNGNGQSVTNLQSFSPAKAMAAGA